jgi:molybdenum cofactor cytidylyltransferase
MSAAKKIPPFAAIILGAGASARMGRPKLLLPWRGSTVIGEILRQWRALGAAQIAVVGRPNDEKLVQALKREALQRTATTTLQRCNVSTHYIVNPHPDRGMFSSVVCAAGWSGWKKKIASWAIVLGDQPHLRAGTLRQLLVFHAAHAGAICQPEFDGHTRHPVILPRAAFAQLTNSRAATLNDFLKLVALPRVQCPVPDAGLSLDLDTPVDYKRLQAFAKVA